MNRVASTTVFGLGLANTTSMQNAFLERLKGCRSVMLVGAGGGYDLYCGLPRYHSLRGQGQRVHLASLNFSRPGSDLGCELRPGLVEIEAPAVVPPRVGAETCLSLWFAGRGEHVTILNDFEDIR